ncbi:tRNA (N6-isopentenyl adenosine(37)-C2)-methylthiotransferase MiaB [Candidatus Peregrinibacteria bacterium]|nr:tRNA (N6-isopentenyl adenosine(37)-C2)-methylthiotransferase MiaB [Candidatus Peregrinibacteria bacterium]
MPKTRSQKKRLRKFYLKTFGCQMNYSDSERLETVLESLNLKKSEVMEDADIVLLNTCSIKQHAEDRVYGFVHNAKKAKKLVGLTGCMVKKSSTQKDEEHDPLLKKHETIDLVFRIEDLPKVPDLLQKYDPKLKRPEYEFDTEDYFHISPKLQENFRAFVPIMTGCDKFCTYCVVPFTRGRERSRPFRDIVKECKNHVANGVKEITLVGQNVNAYFLDDSKKKMLQKQTDFAVLLEKVAEIPKLKRLKFTSPHPRHMGNDVLQVIARNENISRSIHLPVQSGSSSVLQKMGRDYRIEKFKEITKRARELIPGVTLTTDIIVGFSGETEEDFQKTLKLFDEEQFLMAYISKYSPRKGTFAGEKMPDDISRKEKKRRLDIANEKLKKTALHENKRAVGTREYALIESVNAKNIATGKTEFGRTAMVPVGKKGKRFIGEIVPVKITEADTWVVRGELL